MITRKSLAKRLATTKIQQSVLQLRKRLLSSIPSLRILKTMISKHLSQLLVPKQKIPNLPSLHLIVSKNKQRLN